eukprot:6126653-Pyramimonas_sp.AAC.1
MITVQIQKNARRARLTIRLTLLSKGRGAGVATAGDNLPWVYALSSSAVGSHAENMPSPHLATVRRLKQEMDLLKQSEMAGKKGGGKKKSG